MVNGICSVCSLPLVPRQWGLALDWAFTLPHRIQSHLRSQIIQDSWVGICQYQDVVLGLWPESTPWLTLKHFRVPEGRGQLWTRWWIVPVAPERHSQRLPGVPGWMWLDVGRQSSLIAGKSNNWCDLCGSSKCKPLWWLMGYSKNKAVQKTTQSGALVILYFFHLGWELLLGNSISSTAWTPESPWMNQYVSKPFLRTPFLHCFVFFFQATAIFLIAFRVLE